MTAEPFSEHMEAVARKCLGEPNARLSSATELRFGNHGSLSVDLEKGTFFDHEAGKGGGVVALLAREMGLKGAEAVEWLRREVGADLEDRRPSNGHGPKARIAAAYDYVDEHGVVLFQVCRLEPKTFRQRRPDSASHDGWSWSIKGVRQIPYRLPQVMAAIAAGETVYIVEGEKDADNLAKEGLCATCNAMGAGKWSDDLSELLIGADAVILPDNDDAGRAHGRAVAQSLLGRAKRVRLLELPFLPPRGDVSDWLNDGGDAETLGHLVEATAKQFTPQPPESRFGAIVWRDIETVAIRQDWLVEDLIFGGDSGLLFGASGCGKSFLAVDMGLSIARGAQFLGKACRKGGVLYQAGEGGKGLVKRLRAYRLHHRVTEDLPFVLLPSRVNFFAEDGDLAPFIDECRAWRAVMPEPLAAIFIDTFSTASPGANENASEDMSRLIGAGEEIQKATGASLWWVHHMNAAGLRERGHTSLRANIDTAIEVTKDEESKIRTARLAKLKDGEDGLKLTFDLQSVTVGAYDDGKPMTSCVVVPAQAETDRTGRRRPLPRGQQRFLKALDAAVSQYGGVVPGVGVYGVEWTVFKDLFVSLCGQGMNPDAIRQTLSRDGNDLWLSGRIGREDQWLWITKDGGEYL